MKCKLQTSKMTGNHKHKNEETKLMNKLSKILLGEKKSKKKSKRETEKALNLFLCASNPTFKNSYYCNLKK